MATRPINLTPEEMEAELDRLRRREVLFEATQKIGHFGYCDWDYTNARIISCTQEYAQIFGMSIAEVIESQNSWEKVLEQIHPADREHYANSYKSYLSTGSHEVEYRVYRKDGQIRHIKEIGIVQYDSNGKESGSVGLLQDITDHKKREQNLENRNVIVRQFELIPEIGHYIWNIDTGIYEYISPGFARIFGVSTDEFLQQVTSLEDDLNLIYEDDQERMMGIYISRKISKDADAEYRVRQANGEIRWIREISIARWNPTTRENQAIGVLQDITEQKKIEQRLLKSKDSLEAIVAKRTRAQKRLEKNQSWYVMATSTAKLGHWHFDELNDVYLNISDQYADIFGYTTDEFLKRFRTYEADLALVHPDDAERVDKEYDLGQDYTEIDYRIRHADGELRHVREISKHILDESGTLIETMGTLQDVTELKQAQLEAERANLAKSEFLSRMSHELRTPLNAILGFAELVGIDDSIGQKSRSGMREISRAGKHLLVLIDEILDLSGIEAGEVKMSIEPVLVIDLIRDSLTWVTDLAKNHGISIDCDLASFGGLSVLADTIRLKQVFLNLLSNAVKYNLADGRVTIIQDTTADGLTRIGIRDTGPGISENQLSQLFQPFNRLGAENSEVEGTGIGLVITRRLMDLMQGRLEVDSVPGKGSTFWIELPGVQLVESQAADTVEPGSNKESTQTMPRVLVAEDNQINLLLIEAQLEELGCQADFAENGVEALKLWQGGNYNLLMTDIRMPVMDGYELISQIRSQEDGAAKASPIVVISANAMDDDVKRCIEAGADDVMSKPFSLEDLRKTLKKWALMH